jgi:hypothetical protein
MIPIIDNAYYKLGGTVIGILTSYVLYENVYNKICIIMIFIKI